MKKIESRFRCNSMFSTNIRLVFSYKNEKNQRCRKKIFCIKMLSHSKGLMSDFNSFLSLTCLGSSARFFVLLNRSVGGLFSEIHHSQNAKMSRTSEAVVLSLGSYKYFVNKSQAFDRGRNFA